MIEEQSWRDLLGEIISNVHERQRIADALSVNPVTLTRWTSGKSNPRTDNLRPLLSALPQYRTQLTQLISKEFPTFLLTDVENQQQLQEISATFYAQVLETYTSNPIQLRTSTVSALILRHMLAQLDAHQTGLALIIVKCTTPPSGKKVRSLFQTHGRGTNLWSILQDNHAHFYGAESQAGHALITGHPIILQSRAERKRLFPVHDALYEQSSAVYPILLGERTSGCLGIISAQENYFTSAHLKLIEAYVDLLVLAFEPHEFYDLRSIELGIMPDYNQQILALTHVQQRVMQHMIQAMRQQRQMTRPEAERIVWQELEEELLCQSYTLDKFVTH
jgi:hypothetical protein